MPIGLMCYLVGWPGSRRPGVSPTEAAAGGDERVRCEYWVGWFIAGCCPTGPECKSRADAVYQRYQRWHKETGERGEPVSLTAFGRGIKQKGVTAKPGNGMWSVGLMVDRIRCCSRGWPGSGPWPTHSHLV
jgi:hypothetical protein